VDKHTITVTGYGANGDGVARLSDGKVVFIRGAARGDTLEVQLTEVQPKSARAAIVKRITPSPHRIRPDCRFYPECGGCDFRHITYAEELDAKLRRVNDALERIGKQSINVSEILTTGQVDGYRNKVVLHSDGTSLGYYRSGSHDIVPIDRCLLLKEDLNEALSGLSLSENATPRSGSSGSVPQRENITLRSGSNEPALTRKSVTLRTGSNRLAPPLEEELDGLVFGITGFFQVNTSAALLLYKKAREYAALSRNETLLDLYCGVGSLTLFAGRDAGRAIGVEINTDAVKAARENARRNELPFIEFINEDVSNWYPGPISPDCIIVDPPRKGLSKSVIRKIHNLSPKRIVYISCDPATLARDLCLLEPYTVKEISAIDMFPRTANVEVCCLLSAEP